MSEQVEKQKSYLSKVQDAGNGQVAVDFPAELYAQLKWTPGDLLVWAPLPSGEGFVVSKMSQE